MRLLNDILATVYPRLCAGCGRVLLREEKHVCSRCLQALKYTEEDRIRGNSLEMLFANFAPYEKETIYAKRLERGAAYTYYAPCNPIRSIVRQIKFEHGDPELARWLGQQAALQFCRSHFWDDIDLLIPIPLHPSRYAERGFNQSEWLARGIADVTGLPVDTSHLYRMISTEQQSLKTLDERRKMTQPFALLHAEDMKKKHVLLIDDICTSGTTMQHALSLFRRVYGCRYSIFALSFAKH